MSSPPHFSHSPPYSGSLSLSKKRPAGHSTNPGASKRRKPSTSSSSHPLRQTSFPPPESYGATSRTSSYSPTVEGSIHGGSVARSATAASSAGGRGRRRGGKGKADARSVTVGSSAGAGAISAAGNAPRSNVGGRDDYEGDDDDNDGDALDDGVEEVKEDEAAQKMAAEHMAMLVNAFNNDQTERYNVWRRIKLKKETVRRITNQTLSQSVSQPVIMVINGYTKSFIGELLERARDVQTEWLAASPSIATGETKVNTEMLLVGSKTVPADDIVVEQETKATDNPHTVASRSKQTRTANLGLYVVEEKDRGPLMPDHLREALRRYKKDREGGSAGLQGLSLHGREAVAARSGGRRLFR